MIRATIASNASRDMFGSNTGSGRSGWVRPRSRWLRSNGYTSRTACSPISAAASRR